MKMIVILLALVIVGLLVAKQLKPGSSDNIESSANATAVEAPKVPTAPQDVKKFEKDMNDFMQETNDKRMQEINEISDKP